MSWRWVVAFGAALLLSIVVVRNAVVEQFSEVRPALASVAWPGHPQAELWSALTDIAAATRDHREVGAEVLARVKDAAAKDPLAVEPFLIRGVQARTAGDEAAAASAFEAAELRNGRSIPARYFLADHYLRSGDAVHGLRETAVLARMIPNGVTVVAPYVAAYAEDPRNWTQVRALFRAEPAIAEATLGRLALDPAKSRLVLQLATLRPGAPAPMWAGSMLSSLVQRGDYADAYALWQKVSGARAPSGLIYDADFKDAATPPPFNWTLAASSLGLAERQPGGGLHVIYYGQEDGVLAGQLLLLRPGRYELRARTTGNQAKAGPLSWTVTCAKGGPELLHMPLGATFQGSFTVPAGCAAQRLELTGSAPDIPQSADVTVSGLALQAEASGV